MRIWDPANFKSDAPRRGAIPHALSADARADLERTVPNRNAIPDSVTDAAARLNAAAGAGTVSTADALDRHRDTRVPAEPYSVTPGRRADQRWPLDWPRRYRGHADPESPRRSRSHGSP